MAEKNTGLNRRGFLASAGITAGAAMTNNLNVAPASNVAPAIVTTRVREKLARTDVLVVGGGPAGIGAALGAAGMGAKTMNRKPAYLEYRWVQFITTNVPLGGMQPNIPYNDPQPPDDAKPYYLTDAQLPGQQNRLGYDLIFPDQPKRFWNSITPANPTVDWKADLYLVGVRLTGSSGYRKLLHITYGFHLNIGNVVRLDPLVIDPRLVLR